MRKISITIKDNSLVFSFNYKIDKNTNDLLNTNIISDNRLIFSDEYIEANHNIFGLFIKEIINDKKITTIIITNLSILSIIKDSLEVIDKVDKLYVNDENNFTFEAYEILVKLKKFKSLNCYSIPTYMIELFDKNNINVESRQEILYTSNFMEENNLTSYSKIYYKNSLKIEPPMTIQDIKDFESFVKINRYLKVIHFNACSFDAIDNISLLLIENRIKNVKLIVHDNITRKEMIENLKKKKKLYKKNHIDLQVNYTKEYVSKNLMKQVITTTLLLCAFIVLVIASGSTIYVILNNAQSEKNVEEIKQKIEEKISQDSMKKTEIEGGITPTKLQDDDFIPKMKSLLELNSDTVGWIKVPGTNVDYPIVQTNNNDYYLDHNFDKKKDFNGWVFMNYSNKPDLSDQNTIIFGHNIYYSTVMFGTLNNLLNENWYSNANNISIFYDTLYRELEFEVFSVYKIKVTDDYLKTNFESENEYLDFISMIKERSIFQSDRAIHADDKIITLSTCLQNDRRLVVHAVLKK